MAASGRILIIDDEPELAMAIAVRLRAQGFSTLVVYNGPAGVQQATEWQPDAVVLDMLMPGMDGLEVCRQLKAREATRHIPVLMLTAARDLRIEERCTEAGASRAMHKPYDAAELLQVVVDLVQHEISTDGKE